ncbi:PREDICTED: cadherin-related family member 4, partial [Buceros rhinoceros silvestris]|uniref:cadherin-related family member 4 n=1 Tax=Buceros rhinoceros silvestris TaxID=175836 RepID=UPI000528D806
MGMHGRLTFLLLLLLALQAPGTPLSAVSSRQVTLHASAELDARRVNQYTLTLRAACPGEDEVEERLFVRVTVGQALGRDTPFASFRLQNQDTPLRLTHRGLVLAPTSGFDPSKDTQTFRLEIEVTDRHGHNCSGVVRVEVLPSHRSHVTFLEPQRAVMVPAGTGPLEVVTQVHATGDNVRYAILAPVTPELFIIDEMTGEIRSTRRLEVANVHLLIRAYNALHPTDHATAALNVTVQGMDQRAPSCVPAISVSQVPETVSPGSTLVTLRCTESTEGRLQYVLEGPLATRYHFRMEGPRLQVNTTLDYDSEAMDAVGFQLTATIVVTAGGAALCCTARVPVLVTVTPVNEFTPVCPSSATFTVPETAAFGTIVGRVVGTDRDYPRDSLEYSLEEGNEDGHFRLEGNTVFYLPNDPAEPRTFVLLVEVWGGAAAPHRSTVVALVVHVTPRSTPVPPSTTTQRTTLQKELLVVTRTEAVWLPPAWFVAVLTTSGALLLATLGCLARSLLCSNRAPSKLLLDR